MNGFIDFQELVKRIIKYLVMGITISIICLIVPRKPLQLEEILSITLVAASVFAICDTFLPSISGPIENGIGFSLGSTLAGGIRLAAL